MARIRIISMIAAAFVGIAVILAVVCLFAGPWVEAKVTVSDDSSGEASAGVAIAPGSICLVVSADGEGGSSSKVCYSPDKIETSWSTISGIIRKGNATNKFPDSTTGSSIATMLNNVYNLVAAGAVGCVACLVIYLPFLIREACGGVAVVRCCGKWTAIIGGASAMAGGVLVLAAYGVVADSALAKDTILWWNLGSVTSNRSTASSTAGFTPVMFCAVVGGAFAIIGALLIIVRGTVCVGDDDDDDGIGEPITKANPFHGV